MRAEGQRLSEISSLFESGAIHRVIDRIFPLQETESALAYIAISQAGGNMVALMREIAIRAGNALERVMNFETMRLS
jgi:hypothetical protein